MGLTTWKGAKVRKSDVTVAKNYLDQEEIQSLNRIVTMYLDYAESQAERRQALYMRDWREKLEATASTEHRQGNDRGRRRAAELSSDDLLLFRDALWQLYDYSRRQFLVG